MNDLPPLDFAKKHGHKGSHLPLRMDGSMCPAVLTVHGEHYHCDWPARSDGTHPGWAHTSSAAQAVWCGGTNDCCTPNVPIQVEQSDPTPLKRMVTEIAMSPPVRLEWRDIDGRPTLTRAEEGEEGKEAQ